MKDLDTLKRDWAIRMRRTQWCVAPAAIVFIGVACNRGTPEQKAVRELEATCGKVSPRSVECRRLILSYSEGPSPLVMQKISEVLRDMCAQNEAFACRQQAAFALENGRDQAERSRGARQLEELCTNTRDVSSCAYVASLYLFDSSFAEAMKRGAAFAELACEQGDANGCYSLASAYEAGLGVMPNIGRALELYEGGCRSGGFPSCASLSSLASGKHSESATARRAIATLTTACTAQVGAACTGLGYVYSEQSGIVTGQTLASAATPVCDALEIGGCGLLGSVALALVGNGPTMGLARQAFEKACALGSQPGCGELAVFHANGYATRKDPERARVMYTSACESGYTLSCVNLGGMLDRGEGGGREPKRAKALFAQACGDDEAMGCTLLAEAYAIDGETAEAAGLYGRACAMGEASACSVLGSEAYKAFRHLLEEAELRRRNTDYRRRAGG